MCDVFSELLEKVLKKYMFDISLQNYLVHKLEDNFQVEHSCDFLFICLFAFVLYACFCVIYFNFEYRQTNMLLDEMKCKND